MKIKITENYFISLKIKEEKQISFFHIIYSKIEYISVKNENY